MAQAKQASTPIIAMRGAGYYSANTAGAKTVIDRAGDLVLEALAAMPLAASGPAFQIADFGAADGGTSLDMMRRLIAAIRERAPMREIAITYTDLPHNDFSAMFRLLHGMGPVPDEAPLARAANVLTFASGTSFSSSHPADGNAQPRLFRHRDALAFTHARSDFRRGAGGRRFWRRACGFP